MSNGSLNGKVALVTGAARGVGRAMAIAMAREGADVALLDICAAVSDDVEYPPATREELDGVADEVRRLGRRATTHVADVRDYDTVETAVRSAVAELGGLDIVCANAGYVSWHRFWEISQQEWQSMLDVSLTGMFNVLKAVAPIMIDQGRGGSIVITSSTAGIKALPGQMHYTTAKHGLVGMTKAAALELAPHRIRVNSLHPTIVATHMGKRSQAMLDLLAANPHYGASFGRILTEPAHIETEDLAQTVLFLVSPAAQLMTGQQVIIDAGSTIV